MSYGNPLGIIWPWTPCQLSKLLWYNIIGNNYKARMVCYRRHQWLGGEYAEPNPDGGFISPKNNDFRTSF